MLMLELANADAAGAAPGTPAWIPIAVLLVVIAVFLAVLLALRARRRSGHRARVSAQPSFCQMCGSPFPPAAASCPRCGALRPPPPARLEFIYGPLEGREVELSEEITTLGSAPGNHIVLPDPGVSRKHLGIRRESGGYELADLGSTNGVYVNGQRLAKRALVAGDIIRIGSSEMVFHLEKVG